MQRVTNCLYVKNDQVLLLKKPRRGWWAIPGGKMEPQETVKHSVKREFKEETGLIINNPVLKGIYTFLIRDGEQIVNEWMMFTFLTTDAEGELQEVTDEGLLAWHPIDRLNELPMAKGDHIILEHALHGKEIQFGTFLYTVDQELITFKIDT
mgnify:FL=1